MWTAALPLAHLTKHRPRGTVFIGHYRLLFWQCGQGTSIMIHRPPRFHGRLTLPVSRQRQHFHRNGSLIFTPAHCRGFSVGGTGLAYERVSMSAARDGSQGMPDHKKHRFVAPEMGAAHNAFCYGHDRLFGGIY